MNLTEKDKDFIKKCIIVIITFYIICTIAGIIWMFIS